MHARFLKKNSERQKKDWSGKVEAIYFINTLLIASHFAYV
jgi:hypothetical protein